MAIIMGSGDEAVLVSGVSRQQLALDAIRQGIISATCGLSSIVLLIGGPVSGKTSMLLEAELMVRLIARWFDVVHSTPKSRRFHAIRRLYDTEEHSKGFAVLVDHAQLGAERALRYIERGSSYPLGGARLAVVAAGPSFEDKWPRFGRNAMLATLPLDTLRSTCHSVNHE